MFYGNPERNPPLAFGLFFVALLLFCFLTGFGPTHDASGWHAAFHFFYENIGQGVVPYWNPYSQTGTPFFHVFQIIGLLEPTQTVVGFLHVQLGLNSYFTFLLHYFFMYFVFILGTYFVLKEMTQSKRNAFWFSTFLLLALFPVYIKQNGALNPYFMLPFSTYLFLRFVHAVDHPHRGRFFFGFMFLCGIAMNIHVPIGTFLFFILLVLLGSFTRYFSPLELLRYLFSRSGLGWLISSVFVVGLLVLPVFALQSEFSSPNEMFPSVRLFQHNGNLLYECVTQGIGKGLLAEAFSRSEKHSLTAYNFLGLFLEPVSVYAKRRDYSEILTYLSLIPLVSIFLVFKQKRNNMVLTFWGILLVFMFVVFNFHAHVTGPPSLNQRIVMTIFPFLKTSATVQNMGIPFIFALTLVACWGFTKSFPLEKSKLGDRLIMILFYKLGIALIVGILLYLKPTIKHAATFLALEYSDFIRPLAESLYPFYLSQHPYDRPGIEILMGILYKYLLRTPFILMLLYLLWDFKQAFFRKVMTPSRNRYYLLIAFTLLDLGLLIVTQIRVREVVTRDHTDYLKKEKLLEEKRSHPSIFYRHAYSFPDDLYVEGHGNITLMGQELFTETQVAFPSTAKRFYMDNRSVALRPEWDHFFMTKYYYDYLSNTPLTHQYTHSGVDSPLVRFVDESKIQRYGNVLHGIQLLNQKREPGHWYEHITMLGPATPLPPAPETKADCFKKREKVFDPLKARYLRHRHAQVLEGPFPDPEHIRGIRRVNVNEFQIDVTFPKEGYLYIAEGYSRHWTASVAQKPLPVHQANLNFMAVKLPQGEQTVHFRYVPARYHRSLILYLIGLSLGFSILGGHFLRYRKRAA